MTNNKLPLFIDFEASSLNVDSYPIEVAWSVESGSIESHLINPYSVDSWTDWEPAAQEIHGLSRQRLSEEGREPKWVAKRMNEVLAGKTLLTNAYEFDLDWCETLFKAANEKMDFKFGDAWTVMGRKLKLEPTLQDVMLDKPASAQAVYDELRSISKLAWGRAKGERHRAAVDVQQLQDMWDIVQKRNNKGDNQ